MKKPCLFFLFTFISFFSFCQNDKQIVLSNNVSLRYYLGEGYNRIELNTDEIRIADSLVSIYIEGNLKEYSWARKIENYYDYYRQYAGYKNGSPERIVFINAFLLKNDKLSKQILEDNLNDTKGGGSSYFKIKVNLESKACFGFHVNAPK